MKEVESLANAAISVVRGQTQPKDVMKIEVIATDPDVIPPKPVYAIGSLHWGAYRDALALRDKYWYTGPLREYSAFLFNAFGSKLTWNCAAKLTYTTPCEGCSNCYVKRDEPTATSSGRRWWSSFIPRVGFGSGHVGKSEPDYTKVINENCKNEIEINVEPSELLLSTNVLRQSSDVPELSIQLGSKETSGIDFISKSWSRLRRNSVSANEVIGVRTVEIIPAQDSTDEKELFFSIDNEAYEVKPVRVSIMPRAVDVFTLQ